MIGKTLEVRRKSPIVAILLLLVAVACIAISISLKLPDWAIFSILPAATGAALLFSKTTDFHAVLTGDSLYFSTSGEQVPYSQITRLWRDGLDNGSSIYIFHQDGITKIPPGTGMDNDELYSFLRAMAPAESIRTHSMLQNFLQSAIEMFGIDRVWSHGARPNITEKLGKSSLHVIIALFVTAMSWLFIGAAKNPVWAAFGIMLFMVSLFAIPFWFLRNQRSAKLYGIRNPHESSLVISPAGLAVVQGDLTGQLRWAEVQGIKFRNSTSRRHRRIELRVEGAQIAIRDLYEVPLTEIHRRIDDYWRAG